MSHQPLLSTVLVSACCALALPASAEGAKGCAAKREHLQQQIEAAKIQGNRDRQAGLEEALNQVRANCDDASLSQSREEKVLEAEHEVRTREAELKKALSKDDPEKVEKRKAKLAEAQDELREAQEALER